MLNDINEQDTSFLDCKHKHMMKNGAPPHKVRSPVLSVWFQKENRLIEGLSLFGSWSYLILKDSMGPFNSLK